MKEVVLMDNNGACRCENCGRTTEYVQVDFVVIARHSAQLCLACAHVLSMPHQHERFFKLVRKKDVKQSNVEMQKAHRLLSGFIAVGATLAAVTVAVVSMTQGIEVASTLDFAIDSETLTFLNLKSFN